MKCEITIQKTTQSTHCKTIKTVSHKAMTRQNMGHNRNYRMEKSRKTYKLTSYQRLTKLIPTMRPLQPTHANAAQNVHQTNCRRNKTLLTPASPYTATSGTI